MQECMVVGMLGAGIGSDDLRKTLVDEHTKMFLCCLIMYDEWRVVQRGSMSK
jgi:hypothetical protein